MTYGSHLDRSCFQVNPFQNADALAEAAASRFLELIARAPQNKPFHVALAGGRVTRKSFNAIVAQAKDQRAAFDPVHFFWGDERCVPPSDPESNFALAKECLLEPLQIPESRIHRIRGELPPDQAAREAEAELKRFVPVDPAGLPILDLVLLGMGEDGHVASLFPGEPEEVIRSPAVYRPVVASKPPPNRVTISDAALAAACQVWVLASGSGKEKALSDSLHPAGTTPLARLLRQSSQTVIFTDIRLS